MLMARDNCTAHDDDDDDGSKDTGALMRNGGFHAWQMYSPKKALHVLKEEKQLQPLLNDFARKCRREKVHFFAPCVHAHVTECGSEDDKGNYFSSKLNESGRTKDSQQIFDNLGNCKGQSLNLLISDFVKHGKLQRALDLYEKMQKDDLPLKGQTFMALLKACAKLKDLERGFKLHVELDRLGLPNRNVFLGSALVDMYAKSGLLAKAQEVFDKMLNRNVVTWTTLIAAYVDNEHGEQALECLDQMQIQGVLPNSITWICSLKACGSLRALGKGQEIHAEVERQGLLQKHRVIGNTLVDMYVKCGVLDLAKQVFDKLPVRDVVSWTALIAGYAEHGYGEEAITCFEHMQIEGVSPNVVTLVCGLKACSSVGDKDKGRGLHAEIERQGLLERDSVVAGNALVDMYARCGLLHSAQQVLDKLSFRDVITWTALISGYVEHGYVGKALECYKLMQLEGVPPNVVTFVCVLNACGIIGATDKAREIHCEIERKGLVERDGVSKILVGMYANFGLLATAAQVFDKIQVKNLDLWNALILGYVEHGRDEEALKYFELMQLEGIFMDGVTLVCCLKACGSIGAVEKGQEVHSEVERLGLLETDLVMGTALVDMYAKCGLLTMSQQVFDSLPMHNVVTWTAIIAGYAEHGLGEEALKRFDLMQLKGVTPNITTFVCSLKACGSIQAEEKGKEIHFEVERLGLSEENLIVGNALVDMYAKCGLLVTAQEVFDKLPARDVISWTALLMGYVENGLGEEALECFEQMQLNDVSTDAIAVICCLKACGTIQATDKGQDIHATIKKQGLLGEDLIVGSTLVDMYAKCGLLALAQEAFDNLVLRDQVLWNALIGGYVEHGKSEEALKWIKQMQHEGISLNADTFVQSLKACSIAGALLEGQKLHVEIESRRLAESNVYVGGSLVDMYAKCGSFKLAQQVLDKLPVQNVVSWTALIAGYEEHGHGEEALKCFDNMHMKGVFPNTVTYVSVLKACGGIGAIDKGEEIHAEAERRGLLAGDLVIGNALVDMYVKCGSLAKAEEVFDMLAGRNVISWTTLLAGYAQLGESEHALHLLDRMIEDGVMPNSVTFAIIISACSRAGLFNESHMILEAMSNKYGIVPGLEHFTWVIDDFCRAGKLDNAIAMMNKMPFCPNPVVWHTLLSACEKWGSAKLGKEAFEHAMRLDDKDAEAFVLMSQIYASSGFQDQVSKVETLNLAERHKRQPDFCQ